MKLLTFGCCALATDVRWLKEKRGEKKSVSRHGWVQGLLDNTVHVVY